jgi:hypothetical protein
MVACREDAAIATTIVPQSVLHTQNKEAVDAGSARRDIDRSDGAD